MQKKLMAWKTKGMSRDLSVSAFNPEFSFENINLRLSTNESNTQMSWVNERGTAAVSLVTGKWESTDTADTANVSHIIGVPIGTAVLNHQLVLFTTGVLDYIYVFKFTDDSQINLKGKLLYSGNLGFKSDHPLETLVSYESELVQKVYWVDGINQPRVINIVGNIKSYNDTQFDFIPTLQLQETVKVSKKQNSTGSFPAGVIQYAFTYYNKYGQESNIFYTSPLRYVSPPGRGGAPDERVSTSFEIEVQNFDRNFDYLRIYSIERTSLNGTPICKRVADIELSNIPPSTRKVSYIDTGINGDSIDPTELLFKGGESITAETFTQKDNTLFFGNVKITRSNLQELLSRKGFYNPETHKISGVDVQIDDTKNVIYSDRWPDYSEDGNTYKYFNQLNCSNSSDEYGVPCAGFKRGDTYRCGVQFQYKNGKWTDPFFVKDFTIPDINYPTLNTNQGLLSNPRISGIISSELTQYLLSVGYKKARAVIVYPEVQDRKTLCQGIINPTVFTDRHRGVVDGSTKDLYAQSSWFFRPKSSTSFYSLADGLSSPYGEAGELPYTKTEDDYNPIDDTSHLYINQSEIQGSFEEKDRFQVDWNCVTFHSPDVEFDTQLMSLNYANTSLHQTGWADFDFTMSDIDIQTETPPISRKGGGFIHHSFISEGSIGIISGLFYDDFAVDETPNGEKFEARSTQRSPYRWLIYPWHRTGSLNNDINRPSDKGIATAVLKKKVISNLRYSNTTPFTSTTIGFDITPELYASDEATITKIKTLEDTSEVYMGNIDTLLTSDLQGLFFAFDGSTYKAANVKTEYNSSNWWKLFVKYRDDGTIENHGIYKYNKNSSEWQHVDDAIASDYDELAIAKHSIRMKYKSTPHLVFDTNVTFDPSALSTAPQSDYFLPIVDIRRKDLELVKLFGGTSLDALKANVWLPCGKPVELGNKTDNSISTIYTKVNYNYGDTYLQRWDCLKTYAFTKEDTNQLIEIGSFVLESHVNIDGRYDRNRGQLSNINMSPQNFNLLNPVYNQKDNFFSYRIMDDDYYKNISYPNQITWSRVKQSNADTDVWNNITLASIMELDGDKGQITSLQLYDNKLLCFQDQGISQILYNENTQISTEAGVPIEIANSGKIQGKRYISDTVGCSNKWSICPTTMGIYFMDSNEKSIYRLGNNLESLSLIGGFNSWCKQQIPTGSLRWNPLFPTDNNNSSVFISQYDRQNQDVLFINADTALAWSEKLGVFTSFYDYGDSPYLCNLDDIGLWVKYGKHGNLQDTYETTLWRHQAGDYCSFFGSNKSFSLTLVGNPEPQTDKIFTNLEFRACVDEEGTFKDEMTKFTPFLPIDYLETWNEYQRGIAYLDNRSGRDMFRHHTSNGTSSLKRKFRIWRCDIPRNNVGTITSPVPTFDTTFDRSFYQEPVKSNKRPMDRMRNSWLYLKLTKSASSEDEVQKRTEIHDLLMTYFS